MGDKISLKKIALRAKDSFQVLIKKSKIMNAVKFLMIYIPIMIKLAGGGGKGCVAF